MEYQSAETAINENDYFRLEGSVTILLERHAPVVISQPMLEIKPCEYTWLYEDGQSVLRHHFRDPLNNHHLWKNDETQTPWTVDFDLEQLEVSDVWCSENCLKTPHHKSMLSFIFSRHDDYKYFQSIFRGKRFINDYEITSLECGRRDTLKEKDQCIKAWELNAELTLTIPVSRLSHGLGGARWRIEHIEVMVSWMRWEKVKTKGVKAEYRKSRNEAPVVEKPPPVRRRSSLLQALSRSKPRSPSAPSMEEEIQAPQSFAQEWPKFLIEFSNSTVRDNFLQVVTEAPVATSPFLAPNIIFTNSLSSSPPASATPSQQTATTTPPTRASSVQGYLLPKRPIELPALDQDPLNVPRPLPGRGIESPPLDQDPLDVQPPLPSLLKDDYMRVGGPSTAPRPISASPVQLYRKLAVGQDEIRILRISGGKHKSPLCCSLIYHRLATPPKYEAMSYCWGNEAATRRIPEGNMKGCLVSEHLWRALKRLRMPSEDRLVWIDAICINQQDVDERNHQLGLMRDIYAKALRTIIWIGDFDPDKKSCKRAFPDDGDTGLTLCVSPGLAETEHENAVEDLRADLQRLQVQSLSRGRSDVWWRRLWCIQEFHFSANKPSVYIGPHAVKWDHFYDLFEEANHPLETFQQLRDRTPRFLGEILALTGAFNSSDPRDRVFALLGMASAAGAVMPPNYHHSVIRVIEEAVLYLIDESSTVDVLLDERHNRLAWGRDHLVGVMPTWIPDLTCLMKTGSTFDWNRSNLLESHKYNAGLPKGPSARKPFVKLGPSVTRLSTDDHKEYDMPRTMHFCAWYFDVIEKRTTSANLPVCEKSPNGYLIYNSRQIRGKIIAWILDSLEYDFDALYKNKKRSKHDLDPNPRIGLLLLDYLLEGRRSHVEELKARIRPAEKNVVKSYEHQLKEDLNYVREEKNLSIAEPDPEITYVQERWDLKISREAAKERFIPERLKAALRSHNKSIEEDFEVARDLGNLFVYARGTRDRFYLNKTNFDAPMRKDVLGCSSIAEVKKLRSQFEAGEIDIEIHEYNAKTRERDFFKTKAGFLGLGPACLEVGDKIVVPLSASRPFILREDPEQSGCHTLVGEAVVPSIMSGKWATLEKDSWKEFTIK